MIQEILNFYKTPGERTEIDPKIADLFPDDISGVVSRVQNILVHIVRMSREHLINGGNIQLPNTVRDIFKGIVLDFSQDVPLQQKRIAICRNFSMLVASVLRSKGIPVRCRCGFAIYFGGGDFEDHWICEYWNATENRWVQVDAQMDEYWMNLLHLDPGFFNPLDLKTGQFFPAGEIWKLYRDGKIDGDICGFSPEKKFGEYYIRGNLMRDLFALNKLEQMYDETIDLGKRDYIPNKKDLEFLDKVAELVGRPDENFEELKSLADSLAKQYFR